MFVVTDRDLQIHMKEIRAKVNEGEDAIYHSKGTDDLVIVSLKRYNQMLAILMERETDIRSDGTEEIR